MPKRHEHVFLPVFHFKNVIQTVDKIIILISKFTFTFSNLHIHHRLKSVLKLSCLLCLIQFFLLFTFLHWVIKWEGKCQWMKLNKINDYYCWQASMTWHTHTHIHWMQLQFWMDTDLFTGQMNTIELIFF